MFEFFKWAYWFAGLILIFSPLFIELELMRALIISTTGMILLAMSTVVYGISEILDKLK